MAAVRPQSGIGEAMTDETAHVPGPIAEFLEARIREDEAVARASLRGGDGEWRRQDPIGWDSCRVEGHGIVIYDEGGHDEYQADHIARHDPARVLRECAAKRHLLASVDPDDETEQWLPYILASVYADHPDYEQKWAL